MKKFKLKELLNVFLFLAVLQFLICLADILLSRANIELSSITRMLIVIISYPICLINSDLPFFVSESWLMLGLYWLINLIIQAIFMYLVLIVMKKLKESK